MVLCLVIPRKQGFRKDIVNIKQMVKLFINNDPWNLIYLMKFLKHLSIEIYELEHPKSKTGDFKFKIICKECLTCIFRICVSKNLGKTKI